MRWFEQDVCLLSPHKHGFNRIDAGISIHPQVTGEVVMITLSGNDLSPHQLQGIKQGRYSLEFGIREIRHSPLSFYEPISSLSLFGKKSMKRHSIRETGVSAGKRRHCEVQRLLQQLRHDRRQASLTQHRRSLNLSVATDRQSERGKTCRHV